MQAQSLHTFGTTEILSHGQRALEALEALCRAMGYEVSEIEMGEGMKITALLAEGMYGPGPYTEKRMEWTGDEWKVEA